MKLVFPSTFHQPREWFSIKAFELVEEIEDRTDSIEDAETETRNELAGDKWLITVAGYKPSRRPSFSFKSPTGATQLARESYSSQLSRFKSEPIKYIDLCERLRRVHDVILCPAKGRMCKQADDTSGTTHRQKSCKN